MGSKPVSSVAGGDGRTRTGHRPSGRTSIIRVSPRPKIVNPYCAYSRSTSGTTTRMIAPSTTPGMLPIPPSTTIARIVIDSSRMKLSGLTKPWRPKKMTPENPAGPAPRAKARSFVVVLLIPIVCAASSSSRIAAQARPIREPWSRRRPACVGAICTSRRAKPPSPCPRCSATRARVPCERGRGRDDGQAGDHVILSFALDCGQCTRARADRPHLCDGTRAAAATLGQHLSRAQAGRAGPDPMVGVAASPSSPCSPRCAASGAGARLPPSCR